MPTVVLNHINYLSTLSVTELGVNEYIARVENIIDSISNSLLDVNDIETGVNYICENFL